MGASTSQSFGPKIAIPATVGFVDRFAVTDAAITSVLQSSVARPPRAARSSAHGSIPEAPG